MVSKMAIKRKIKVIDTFSLSSMTDVIFLLLIFFMVTSTLIVPNSIKVTLPTSSKVNHTELPPLRIDITKDLQIFIEIGYTQPVLAQDLQDLNNILHDYSIDNPESIVAVYADQDVSYSSVIDVIDKVIQNDLKLVLVTNSKN